jgi:hypothetical protein
LDVFGLAKRAKRLHESGCLTEKALGTLYQHLVDMADDILVFGGDKYAEELSNAIRVLECTR